jgi:hypothetical protein
MGLDAYHEERAEAVRQKNLSDLRLDPEEQAARLRDRFKRVSRRLDVALRLRRARSMFWRWFAVLCGAVGIAGGAYLAITTTSPWPVSVTVRHLMAAPNCDAARAVGLAPAVRGAPGYYLSHDRDRDGIACEPWPLRPPHR